MSEPLLSICIAARNDNYGGNFRYIFTTALDFMGRNLRQIGAMDRVEVVVADWNSEVGLAETLAIGPEARALCRFVRVPPALAAPHMFPGKTFSSGTSQNVALRRAQGRFLLSTNADLLWTAASLDALLRILGGQLRVPFDVDHAFMLIRRKMLPWELVARRPSLDALERHIVEGVLPGGTGAFWPGLNGNNAGLLAPRGIWHECKAMDESLRGWGWNDMDLGLRINQRYPSYYLTELGVIGYELDVAPERRQQAMSGHGENPRKVNVRFDPNDDEWGLAEHDLAIERASGPAPEPPAAPLPTSKAALLAELCDPQTTGTIAARLHESAVKQPDFPAGYLLGFCAMKRHPSTFVDFGFMRGAASLFVPALDRCVNVLGVNAWTTPAIVPFANDAADLYSKLGHAGNLQFVSGDLATAVERLERQLPATVAIDLVYLLLDELPPAVLEHLGRLAPRMASAAVVVRGGSPELFARALEVARQLVPEAITVQSPRDRTALVIRGIDDASEPRHGDLERGLFDVLRQA